MGWSGPMTHRQFLAWQTFLELDYEMPSRSDLYVMQLTDVTNQVSLLPGVAKTYDGNRWRIKTTRKRVDPPKEMTEAERLEEARRTEKMFVALYGG